MFLDECESAAERIKNKMLRLNVNLITTFYLYKSKIRLSTLYCSVSNFLCVRGNILFAPYFFPVVRKIHEPESIGAIHTQITSDKRTNFTIYYRTRLSALSSCGVFYVCGFFKIHAKLPLQSYVCNKNKNNTIKLSTL